ncbi:sigma 54-interacting transcriptional regulator [Geosporobacter ferrireducens]|uniref:Sigma-54-dependent Fis family transcriptional regulator n=1 Tax=Geosporobacter ferrireducens TaxID=1424294 RepID=A0A1D8GFB4_9FIRM|nr:sigma 54-interacting transcriptional regulator [Geosporobacter ferrireducens]AOT69588.1 sigma-54-dependent Fis family transcriptional regulator [Geosporobacter ferrireducens]MTI54717.1 PAS domain S-box protein [Geosporobacter ferrireducens]
MKKDIVIISPFETLHEMAMRIVKERGYDNIGVVAGDLSQGVIAAKQAVFNGANVLVSRGGTYSRICEAVDVPVVEIQLTAFDVFNSFKNIRHIDQPIAIIGYQNVIQGYDIIEDLLINQDIIKLTLDDSHSVEKQICQFIDRGIKIFVGDSIVNSVARKHGCISYLIESGEEAIVNAIEEALRVLHATRVERERMQRFMAVIDNTSDGVIATDKESRINVFNIHAEKVLDIAKDTVIGRPILDAIGDNALSRMVLSQQVKFESIHSVGNTKLAINHVPIVVSGENMGSIITFQDVTKIQSLEKKIRIKLSEKGFVARYSFEDIICKSAVMQRCIDRARTYGNYDSSVLISGPSGVGKELFAQSIHNISNRATGPFVPINCAALPPSLIESELFGYVEGAFTGAKKGGKAGLFELAHGGTIFLDEISELPMDLQGRLLRVIQEREVMRIGDDCVIPVDVRVICASNRDLREQVSKGKFRRDLLFRINILTLNIPPLNERREDIAPLAAYFIQQYSQKYARPHMSLSEDALNYLKNFHYEGNVRELQGMIERAVITCESEHILKEDILDTTDTSIVEPAVREEIFLQEPTLRELEKQYIEHVYHKYDGSIGNVCKILGIDRSTLWRKRKSR